MKLFLSYLFIFGLTISAAGQEKFVLVAGKQPYFLVDTFQIDDLKNLILTPDKIESVNVLKDSSAIAAYGAKAKHGAVIIKTKPDTKLLRVADVLDQYKISKADQKLRICINKTIISQPQFLLLAADQIDGVEITTEKNWVHPEDANTNERFINIIVRRTSSTQ